MTVPNTPFSPVICASLRRPETVAVFVRSTFLLRGGVLDCASSLALWGGRPKRSNATPLPVGRLAQAAGDCRTPGRFATTPVTAPAVGAHHFPTPISHLLP
jgi:hypothetical protein